MHLRSCLCPANEERRLGSEILVRVVVLQPRADRVTLTDVDGVTVPLRSRSEQQVDARLLELRPVPNSRVKRPWKDDRFADPVGPFNEAQPIGVAVSNKDSKRKWNRIGH